MARNKELQAYWALVGQVPCLISGNPVTTFHHCHGGSMHELGALHRPGMAQKASDWLIIPIAWEYHFGPKGVDTGCISVREWENRYGTQISLLRELSQITGIDVLAKYTCTDGK